MSSYQTSTNGTKIKILDEFICPISQQIMLDPVNTCDGHIFERIFIEKWLKTRNTSPITNLPLENNQIFPIIYLKTKISEFLEQHPHLKSKQY